MNRALAILRSIPARDFLAAFAITGALWFVAAAASVVLP